MNVNPIAFHPPLPPTHSASFIVWRYRKVEAICFPISAVVHLVIGIIRLVKQCSDPTPDTDYSVAYGEYCLKPKASQHLARGLLLLVPVVGALFLYFYYDPQKKRERIDAYMEVLRDPHFDQISHETPTGAHWDYLNYLCQATRIELDDLQSTHPFAVYGELRRECEQKQHKINCHLEVRQIFEDPEALHMGLYNAVYHRHTTLQNQPETVLHQSLQEAISLWNLAIHHAPTLREKINGCEDALRLFLEWYAQQQRTPFSNDQAVQFVLGKPDEVTKALLDGIRQDPEFRPIFLSLLNRKAEIHEQILDESEHFNSKLVQIHHISCALRYTALLDPDNSLASFNRVMVLCGILIQRTSFTSLAHRAIELLFDWYAFLTHRTLPATFSFANILLKNDDEINSIMDEIKGDPTYWSHLEPWLALCDVS